MSTVFKKIEEKLIADGYEFERKDFNRPWGGFFVIEESQAEKFTNQYFSNLSLESVSNGLKVSPKILMVAPEKRLSWQYHHRRSEVWEIVRGTVGIVRSDSDEEQPLKKYQVGDRVTLAKGERHRLVGLDDWGIVAEIWIHTDPENPSDEDDIVRLQDDFKRTSPK
jgi:mannose-6-phosphate isomerase-like protein (cupin superfamily)